MKKNHPRGNLSFLVMLCRRVNIRLPAIRAYSKLTAEHYNLKRGNYGSLEQSDLEFFKSVVPNGVVTDAADLEMFNEDWMHKYRGQSTVMLKPSTTEQVSKILAHCNSRKLAVVPQGGNTGLVGGSVPVFDEIILSLANMNKIRHFDPVSGILTADAGVILQNADEYLRSQGFIFPLDLGAKGSCQIGGNLATNAGGLRLLRYGSLHGTVLGVEGVLASGEIFDGLSALRKDNTGYDLKQLFIGSEGTLGVITGLSIICPPKPNAVNVAFLGLESFDKVQEAFVKSRSHLSEILSSFECMDAASLKLASRHISIQAPLSDVHPFSVLIETSGSDGAHDEEKLTNFLEALMEEGVISDGVLAQDDTQIANLWHWREFVPEASTKAGGVYKYDVSLPLPAMWELVDATQARLVDAGLVGSTDEFPVVDTIGYGHIGDGNLHLNIAVRRYDDRVEKLLEPFVFEFVAKHSGSVSAEHGLGFQKAHALHYSKSEQMINLMKALKSHYDPNHILNPYKYLP